MSARLLVPDHPTDFPPTQWEGYREGGSQHKRGDVEVSHDDCNETSGARGDAPTRDLEGHPAPPERCSQLRSPSHQKPVPSTASSGGVAWPAVCIVAVLSSTFSSLRRGRIYSTEMTSA